VFESVTSGFHVKLTSPKVLLQILKVLNFREDATVNVGPQGIKITAEISKSFQASAFIQRETFIEYNVSEDTQNGQEDIIFNISLPILIQCLNLCGGAIGSSSSVTGFLLGNNMHMALANILGNTNAANASSTSLVLYYTEIGEPLRIWLEEDGIISGATIPTMDGTDTLSFDDVHHNTNTVARVIMLTEYLKEVLDFHELDSKSDFVEFIICPTENTFSMSTYETAVNFSVEIPFDSEIVSHHEVKEYICVRYQLNLLRHAFKPISMSEKVSFRIDDRMLLSIQYMIQLSDDTKSYMEFYCAPDVEID
jgi:hypothetical protein